VRERESEKGKKRERVYLVCKIEKYRIVILMKKDVHRK